jgi:hypothetical protein
VVNPLVVVSFAITVVKTYKLLLLLVVPAKLVALTIPQGQNSVVVVEIN